MRDEHSLEDPLLTGLFAELRSWGEEPAPAPSEALASLLAADSAFPVAGSPAPRQRRKKMSVSELLAGIGTKLAALGVVAQAALGVGVAAAAVTTAGVTGVLPDQAQHAVATAVEAVTPLQLPDPLAGVAVTGTSAGADENEAGDDAGGTGQPDNHGACVSAVAKDKSVTGREHGQAVSAIAQSDCGKKSATTSSTSSTSSTTVAGGTTANSGPGKSGNAGGNSGNSGSGNSGSGNSGSGKSGSGSNGNGNSNGNGGNSGRS